MNWDENEIIIDNDYSNPYDEYNDNKPKLKNE